MSETQVTIDSVLACPQLPTLPGVALQVLELTGRNEVKLQEIAECVQADQALTGKILKTVNSSFYGLSKPCPTISRAIGYLGLNTVKSLVLGFSLVDMVGSDTEDSAFDYQKYWRRSIYSAAAARILAEHTRTCDPEETFITALLQDVGIIAMLRTLDDAYDAPLLEAGADHSKLSAAEQAAFGFDHADVAAALAQSWRLPDQLTVPIQHHHAAADAPAEYAAVVNVLMVANFAADGLSPEDDSPPVTKFINAAQKTFNIDRPAAEHLLELISEDAGQLSSAFKVDTGTVPNVGELLSEASERIVQHQISQQQQQESLQRSNEQLSKQATTDGLTGAFNRAHFDQVFAKEFAAADPQSAPLSVAFADADKFKGVNDTHGHQVGDAVLIELAKRFQEAVGNAGIVCRYGGEEFSVILPKTGLKPAAKLCEKIRIAVESQPFDLREVEGPLDELPITISIGVASLQEGTETIFTTPEQLLQAADKGVYAAKESGRNCVRAFVPAASAPQKNTDAQSTSNADKATEQAASAPAPQTPVAAQETAPTPPAPVASSLTKQSQDRPIHVMNEPAQHASVIVNSRPVRLLVVDDDPLCANLLRHFLSDLGQCEYLAASSAEEAMEILQNDISKNAKSMPTVILCDQNLPGMTGIELLQSIRQENSLAGIPFVLMSAELQSHDLQNAIVAGVNGILSKLTLADSPGQLLTQLINMWSGLATNGQANTSEPTSVAA